MALVMVGHPDSGFSGYLRAAGRGLFFSGGFTEPVDLTAAQEAELTSTGFTVDGQPDPPVPDPFPQYLTEDKAATAIAAGTGPVAEELRAAFDASAVPAYAAPRTRRFDPNRSVYNLKASNTRRLRARLGAARSGLGLCRISCAGDSLTAGVGATAGTYDYPASLRALLPELGYPSAGTGHVPTWNNGVADAQWSVGGGWQAGGLNGPFLVSYGNDQMTFTSTAAGTVVEIATFGSTTAFTVSIDGGAAAGVSPNGQEAVQVFTYSGLSNTTHSVVITSAGGAGSYVISAAVLKASGALVSNYGYSGSTTTNWTASPTWFDAAALALTGTPDAVLLELGINDEGLSVPINTFQAQLAAIVQRFQDAGADVLLAASNPSQVGTISQAAWDARLARIYDVADARDVPLLDFTDRFGSYLAALGNGLMSDVTHLNAQGYADKARAWANVLAA